MGGRAIAFAVEGLICQETAFTGQQFEAAEGLVCTAGAQCGAADEEVELRRSGRGVVRVRVRVRVSEARWSEVRL